MRLYFTDLHTWPRMDARLRARIEALCSPMRVQRARALAREPDALAVLAAGLLLRYALGCTDEALSRGAHGKPYLLSGPEFSLTHGGALAAILIADSPCGVDTEPLDRAAKQPERLFSAQELAMGLAPAALWTRKEAVFKAAGIPTAVLSDIRLTHEGDASLDGRRFALFSHRLSDALITVAL